MNGVNDCVATPRKNTNISVIEGTLISDVVLVRCDSKKVSKATFCLRNTTRIGENIVFNDFFVIVYGKNAKDCNFFLSTGDNCTVTGKICLRSDENKFENMRCGATLFASDVFWNKE